MRLVVSAFAVAALLSACAKDPATENGTGGAPGTGGKPGTGGTPGTGGKTGTGGTPGTGGSSASAGAAGTSASVSCTDVSTASFSINQQYGNGIMTADNDANKSYNFMSNWWSTFSNEVETISGIGFTLSNPNNASSSNNNPMGFPSIFIGSYQGKTSKGSNLPKAVSALTSVPTFLHTNATSLDTSNFNVTYDVWFTSSNAVVTGSSPGTGGAYLMVWLYKPANRQPRGSIALDGHHVSGVSGSWSVWYDSSTNPPCVSYVASTPISELDFDLNAFIQDAVKTNMGVTSSQYLSIIFGGTEVWGGADGLQIKGFCAQVK